MGRFILAGSISLYASWLIFDGASAYVSLVALILVIFVYCPLLKGAR